MHYIRKILLPLIFVLSTCRLLAQTSVVLKPVLEDEMRFYHLKLGKGLEQNSITHIAQDSTGQMWFATKEGVVRYDAKEFIYYKHDAENPRSIGGNFVERIFVDKDGTVWVGTEPAILSRYHPETDEIIPEYHLKGGRIKDIDQDKEGLLWITTDQYLYSYNLRTYEWHRYEYNGSAGIDRLLITRNGHFFITTNEIFVLEFFPETGQFKEIYLMHPEERQNTRSTMTYSVFLLTEDHEGYVWFTSHLGYVIRYNPETGKQQRYILARNWKGDYGKLTMMFIFEDLNYNLWVGTWFNGLFQILPDRKHFRQILLDKNNPESLSNNIIHSGFQDKAGNLWFGTEYAGMNILKTKDKFSVISYRTDTHQTLPPYEYSFAIRDHNDSLWVGSLGGGLYTAKFKSPLLFNKHKSLPDEFWMNTIRVEGTQEIWLGIADKLIKYNPLTGKKKIYKHLPDNYNSLTPGVITEIFRDKEGIMWIGTTGGLTRFDEAQKKFVRFVHDDDNPLSLSNNQVRSIVADANNDIWVGTFFGLNKLNKQSGNFRVFKQGYTNNSIRGNRINDLFALGDDMWIATFEGGLNRYNLHKKNFDVYDVNDTLPDNNIKAIESDSKGNLWLSTKKNIIKFFPKTGQFINYDASDGLYNKMYVENMGWQELEFSYGFSYKDKDNYLFFGGVGGVVFFHPDSLFINTYQPPVVVQNFFVNGKKMLIPDDDKPIRLKNQQNHLKFDLSVYNYIQPEKNQYAYKLEPYDTLWHYVGHQYTAEYYNLPPGKYTFYYKGSNNDGIWSPVKRFPVLLIANPFYRTTGFYISFLLLIFLLLFVFLGYRYYLKRKFAQKKKKQRYQSSNLMEEESKRIVQKLEQIFKNQKLYLEPDMNLQKLAEMIHEKPHHVSQVINQIYNKRFNDFINTYRIEEAKKLLVETYLKIESVAYDSGFSSLSTFNTVFKKETGTTPSKYRKIHRKID